MAVWVTIIWFLLLAYIRGDTDDLQTVFLQITFTEERVPVVSVIIEGGPTAIRTVLTNISAHPRIPVVVFDGTGRAADILAFAQKYSDEQG